MSDIIEDANNEARRGREVVARGASESALASADQSTPDMLLGIIGRVAADPSIDLDRMDRLMQMHQSLLADQRKAAFVTALAKAQGKFPDIEKLGKSHHGAYGRWEDIQKAIAPVLEANGLSVSFRSDTSDAKRIGVQAVVRHREGHEESGDWVYLPLDTSGNKNGPQQIGSTLSYGKRYAAGLLLNFRVGGEDTDANPPRALSGTSLSEDQAGRIHKALEFLDGTEAALMKWANANGIAGETLADVDADYFDRIMRQLALWQEKKAVRDA